MEHVVEEAVLLVPHADAVVGASVIALRNEEEVLEELVGDVLVARAVTASSSAIASRLRQYIPSSSSRRPARASRRAAARCSVEDADVVEPEEAALKTLLPDASFWFTHHVKFSISLWKMPRGSRDRPSVDLAIDLVDAQRRPRVHGRIHVGERPLVRGELSVRDACTIHASAARAAASRSPGR
jgi:hypothetical protein